MCIYIYNTILYIYIYVYISHCVWECHKRIGLKQPMTQFWTSAAQILHGHWAAQQSDAPLLLQPASGPCLDLGKISTGNHGF